jgi:hypothetical protein
MNRSKQKRPNVDLQKGKTMGDSNAKKNKAIVLEAFDTLFNIVTTGLRSDFGRPTTFKPAPISSRGETGSSTSCDMSVEPKVKVR